MKLMTVRDLATLLVLNEVYVRDVVTRRRDFPAAVRIGNSLRWHAHEIEDWIESRRVSQVSRRSRRQAARSSSSANSSRGAQPSSQVPAATESEPVA